MLRVLPWITDPSIEFLEGYINSKRGANAPQLKIFEFGSGNSTLWFLSKGCYVTTMDHDKAWSNKVQSVADTFGLKHNLNSYHKTRPYWEYYDNPNCDIIFIDGRDRVECLKQVMRVGFSDHSLLVLDNTERITGEYSEYKNLLKSLNVIHFEQPFQSGLPADLSTLKDRAGLRVGHRWITSIAYNNKMNYTTSGILV